MRAERSLVVQHSARAAGEEVTTYATHMAATAGDGIRPVFFSWPRALFGRYDVFHLHWPDGLSGTAQGVKGTITYALTRSLIARLRWRRIPVVYTLHNRAPHDLRMSRRLRRVYEGFERLTTVEIHLVPEPGRVTAAATASIPHGGYAEAFARYPREDPAPGRALFFGLIRPYKGIEELLDAFAALDDDVSLRIVGQPRYGGSAALRAAIGRAASADPRISARLGLVPDRELVAEVTRAQLVVLPYRGLHSSGALLAALSLGRPVLVPDSTTTRALRDEVGDGWVRIYPGTLDREVLEQAIRRTRDLPPSPPDLSSRSWERVRAAHAEVYRTAVSRRRRGRTPRRDGA
ncbi:MAG: glycosyltransferase [Microbacterium sp.]